MGAYSNDFRNFWPNFPSTNLLNNKFFRFIYNEICLMRTRVIRNFTNSNKILNSSFDSYPCKIGFIDHFSTYSLHKIRANEQYRLIPNSYKAFGKEKFLFFLASYEYQTFLHCSDNNDIPCNRKASSFARTTGL